MIRTLVDLGHRVLGEVHPLTLHVTGRAAVEAAAKLAGDRYGHLDVLVNNAGISGDVTRQAPAAPTWTPSGRCWRQLLRRPPGDRRHAAAAAARTAARIVNLSSSAGSLGRMTDPGHYLSQLPGFVAYPSSKTALNMLTVQYAKALRPEGILVNAADPGHCATDFSRAAPSTTSRTAADGAAIAVRLATLGPDGPTGGSFEDAGQVPW